MKKKVAFQGIPGSFSSMAASALFGNDFTPIHTTKFREIFEAVRRGDAAFGVLPIENALAGSVHENADLLAKYNCWICAEYYCPVELLLLSEGSLRDVRLVFSHPKAFEQCSQFLENNPQIQPVFWSDTATAAQHVASQKDPSLAALASQQASERYNLPVCSRDIQNEKRNATRFIAISAQQMACQDPTKCSLMVTIDNEPGSLCKFLGVAASLGLNLTKIESQPIPTKAFEYSFHIDLEKAKDSPTDLVSAVSDLEKAANEMRVLGFFKAHTNPLGQSGGL